LCQRIYNNVIRSDWDRLRAGTLSVRSAVLVNLVE